MEEDDRFKHLASDPKFKVLKKSQRKVQIDERFQSMFKDKKFATSADNLKRFYNIKEDKKIDRKVNDEDEEKGDEETEDEDEETEEDEKSDTESSSSDEAESELESEDENDILRVQFDWQPLDHDAQTAEKTTRRLAIQHLDWDKIDVRDIFTLIKSVRMPLNVRIYISEYGKERLAKEEVEGPQELVEMPKEDEVEEEYNDLRNKMRSIKNVGPKTYKVNEYEDADEQLDLKNEELRERIRTYQLNRMKYYYAIAEFDSPESAELVYKELDGLEYEGSSIELDLRFVPDDIEFDINDVKAECDQVPDLASYKAPQFINSALQQTTVNFTWDQTDVKREEKLRRAYTKEELEKDDLDAYLASETDSDDNNEEAEGEIDDTASVMTGNTEARMNKYQKLLHDLKEEEDKKKSIDVDVEWNAEDEEDDNDDDSDLQASDIDDSDVDDEFDGSEIDDESQESDVDDNAKLIAKKSSKPVASRKTNIHLNPTGEQIDFFDDVVENKEGFEFNPDDERFKAIYESDLYNIDPSRPSFKRTKAFDQIAERKRQKRTLSNNNKV